MKSTIGRGWLLPATTIVFAAVTLLFVSSASVPAQAQELVSEGELVVRYEWATPDVRENGELLPVEEIGGYELVVEGSDGYVQTIVIEDSLATQFDVIGQTPGGYTARVAVFDTDGLYSESVEIKGAVQTSRPSATSEFRSRQLPTSDPVEACASDSDCVVAMLSARYRSAAEGH